MKIAENMKWKCNLREISKNLFDKVKKSKIIQQVEPQVSIVISVEKKNTITMKMLYNKIHKMMKKSIP